MVSCPWLSDRISQVILSPFFMYTTSVFLRPDACNEQADRAAIRHPSATYHRVPQRPHLLTELCPVIFHERATDDSRWVTRHLTSIEAQAISRSWPYTDTSY